MKLVIASVFDTASQAFMRPMFVPHVGQASRSFADEVNRPAQDNVMFNHPEDFILFQLGTFDEESGAFECGPPIQVVRGQDVSKASGA